MPHGHDQVKKGQHMANTTPTAERLPLAKIERNAALNCRAEGINEATAAEYAEALQHGAKLPPVVVFKEGEIYRLADGFHRCRAHEIAGKIEILAEVRAGGEREARLYSVGCNAAHGLRRTNADKRRAVVVLLGDPEWSKLSNREIAKLAAVDDKFVGTVRRELAPTADAPQLTERVGADGKARKVNKRKKAGKLFNAVRAAKGAPKLLDRLAKQWPPAEPIEPLLDAVEAWLGLAKKSGAAKAVG
jgi:uncharacterized ParB-like nuclease family protein